MSLNKIQKTFIRLALNKFGTMGSYKTRRHRLVKADKAKVRVEVIDAVSGDKTFAKASESSPAKLRKWLKLRNARAEFTEVLLKKKSNWFKLSDTDFIDYPVIIKVGTYKAPYLIKRVQDRVTYKGKTTLSIQLETTGNIDYLSILSEKKELLASKKGKK
jgi:hypothetical protein